MRSARYAIAIGLLGLLAIASPVRPITSRAELSAYLGATAKNASPLDALSPRGRARFLASLTFGRHGLGGFSSEDLRAELTRPQVYRILQLFGAEAETGHVVSSGKPKVGHGEYRAVDTIQERYDTFDRAGSSGHVSITKYATWFAHFQKPAALSKLSSADVEILFRAAGRARSVRDDRAYLGDMLLDLKELEKRGVAGEAEYDDVFFSFLDERDFARARQLARTHRTQEMAAVPAFRDVSHDGKFRPTALFLSRDGTELIRKDVVTSKRGQIVVVASPLCHFCTSGIRDIERDPVLWALFRARALWLVPPDDAAGFQAMRAWNRAHPHEAMAWAYSYAEWRALDRWDLPTFYFLKNGKVGGRVDGWPPKGNAREIRDAARAGELP